MGLLTLDEGGKVWDEDWYECNSYSPGAWVSIGEWFKWRCRSPHQAIDAVKSWFPINGVPQPIVDAINAYLQADRAQSDAAKFHKERVDEALKVVVSEIEKVKCPPKPQEEPPKKRGIFGRRK